MDYVPRALANKFAAAYAGDKVGFSAKQIYEYFSKYSNLVMPIDHYGMRPSRSQLFIDSVYALQPKKQYYALNDLAFFELDSSVMLPFSQADFKRVPQLRL